MAANAVAAGFATAVFDARPEPVARLLEGGASAADSTAALCAGCDVLQVVVANDAQVLDLADAAAQHLPRDATFVIHSTVARETCREVGRRLAARDVAVLDAPVSGPLGAEACAGERDLTFMVGGDAAALERVRPLLLASGPRVYHLGALGMGQVAKLAANSMTLTAMQATREALGLAVAAGIDPVTALELWQHTSGNSWAVENWQRMHELAARHPSGRRSFAELGYKDLSHALALGHELGSPLPAAALVAQLLEPEFGLGYEKLLRERKKAE
jgi:3-hydroxyisobutyrate dehydrogenase